MTDNHLLSTKQEDNTSMHSIRHYPQGIESKIVSRIDNYTLASDKRISKIEKTLSELTIVFAEVQSKLNDNKIKCLRIDEIVQSNQKLKDQIVSHDNKISKHTKDVFDSLNKFNQILNDHLTIPGLVGSYCKFKSIREYINYNNQQINGLIISKAKVMNEIEKFQKKIQETLGKFSSQIDKMTHNHSSYFNSSFYELKNSFDESVKEANEKLCSTLYNQQLQQQQLQRNHSADEDNHKERNDDLITEISNMKKDINLIKKHCLNLIRRTSSKDNLLRTPNQSLLKIIKMKSPLTPQYKHKKKKKKGLKRNQCLNSTSVVPNSAYLKKENINAYNEIIAYRTFLTENFDLSYNKINSSLNLNSNDMHETISPNSSLKNINNSNSPQSKADNSSKAKNEDTKVSNGSSNSINVKQKKIVFTPKETKTKEIPYNRAQRNRIQTQMFCGRDKISLLHFESRKDKINFCLPWKKYVNLAKVKSVDYLKARMNNFKSNKNQLSIPSANDSKDDKNPNPNRIPLQTNDKLQIDCSASQNNTEDQGNIIVKEC